MKDYDYHRPAEKVLLDSYRKQNRNKNRLLFLAVALTVGVIFCMISFAYGKIQVDIQKHIRTDGMTVSTYLENGTEEMAGQLHTLSLFFVKYFSLKKASKFPVFVKGFSLLLAGIDYASRRMRACSIR